jgi:hypothetical protein
MKENLEWIVAVVLVIGAAVGIGCLWCALIDILFNKARGIRQWWTGDEKAMPPRIRAIN